MIELESARLRMREMQAEDLPRFLSVYLSNPAFVAMNEGSQGEQGYFDLEMFQRDWQIGQMMPGSHWLGITLKESNIAVGQANFLEEHPEDGMPWIGVLMVHQAYQRKGLGTEVYQRLARYFSEELAWKGVRIGIWRQNATGLAFAKRLGFHPIKDVDGGDGASNAIVLECVL